MQTLPLQYSFSTSTVGGLIATNAYNPKRLLYGGVRDLLLGVRVALPSGEIAHFGGRVVKNVAGYDMCKLFLGSLGAFGVIVEATYKLYALPERDETLLAVFPSMSLSAAAVARIMGTQLLPSQVLLLNPTAAREAAPQIVSDVAAAGVLLLVNCEGMGETVERQMADISRICQGQGATAVCRYAGETQEEMRRRLGILYPCAMRHITPAPQFLARLGTVPSRVPEVMDAIAHSLGPRISRTLIAGDCGCGLIKLCLPWSSHAADDLDASLVHSLRELPRLVAAERGYMVVESAPTHVKAQLDVWGSPPATLTLMQALKKTFDPEGILSAGRFVGGL
jgi:glycolate oxidase FAD binding subunit